VKSGKLHGFGWDGTSTDTIYHYMLEVLSQTVSIYNGATWDIGTLKIYNGATWDEGVLKTYNGTIWVP
jgi:hypothetical protein